nr:hypothetical protein [Tanacetum cinerariifolium]
MIFTFHSHRSRDYDTRRRRYWWMKAINRSNITPLEDSNALSYVLCDSVLFLLIMDLCIRRKLFLGLKT